MKTSHTLLATTLALAAIWTFSACGGQAVLETNDAGPDSASVGGSGGSNVAGSGGSNVGGSGGANVAGSGGSNVGGSGGSNVGGSGGSNVGGSGGSHTCPDLPSCNWCNGTEQIDEHGCVASWRCKNGVDPCTTPPCQSSDDCAPGMICGTQGLCWPQAGPTCSAKACEGTSNTCGCKWTCDNINYGFQCKVDSHGTRSCKCFKNGSYQVGCGSAGSPDPDDGPVDPCDDCCGYPTP